MGHKMRIFFVVLSFLFLDLWALDGLKQGKDNLKYEIWVELNHQDKLLIGRELMSWFNKTGDEISDIWFHLYWNAFKNEKSAMAIEAGDSPFREIGFDKGDWGWIDIKRIRVVQGRDLTASTQFVSVDKPEHPGDQTVMRVMLPEPLKPGVALNLEIEFESKIPKALMRAGYYHNGYFISQWFPKPGVYEEGKGWNCHQYHLSSEFFADFAAFTVHITVPEGFVVGASGREIFKKKNVSLQTITYTFQQDRIHDFAWTADPDYIKVERYFISDKEISASEVEVMSRRLGVPVGELRLPDIKMILLINPEHSSQTERHFLALKKAIKYFGLWFGPYPYRSITMVDPPFGNRCGGMEYPTLFTAGTRILRSKKALNLEGLIIHEFGHEYWYGLCANNEYEEAWLDEGINTYTSGKVLARSYGASIFPIYIGRAPYTRYIDSIRYYDNQYDRLLGINATQTDAIVTNSWQFYNIASYGLNVYHRAAACLYTLENILGRDVMLRVLRTFQSRFRFRHPKTQDFIDTVNQVSDRDMTWFFRELFFKANTFDYGIASVDSKRIVTPRGVFDQEGERVEITSKKAKRMDEKTQPLFISTVNVRRYGEARLGGDVRLKIKIVFVDGTVMVRTWAGQERWKKIRITHPSRIKYAHADPDDVFLIDANITNNSCKLKSDTRGAKRWGSKFLFWIQNILQFFSVFS